MKDDLHRYLKAGREAMLWKLEGLSEYDIRRPMTPTGTNLLGLVKHLAGVETGYFGETFGRPFPDAHELPDVDGEPNSDMWATLDESREHIISLYERACAHSDKTIEELDLDSMGHVQWWPPDRADVSLHRALVHMIAETHRHAGQADIVREAVDGTVGMLKGKENMPEGDREYWETYRAKLEEVAKQAGSSTA